MTRKAFRAISMICPRMTEPKSHQELQQISRKQMRRGGWKLLATTKVRFKNGVKSSAVSFPTMTNTGQSIKEQENLTKNIERLAAQKEMYFRAKRLFVLQ